MNQVISVFLTILIIVLPVTARAEGPCVDPMPVTSPCTGILLPPEAATQGLECLKIAVPRLKLDILKQEELFNLRIDTMGKLIQAEVTRANQLEALLNKSLETRESPSFFEGPVFWTLMGVVIGTAASIGIAYAMSDAARQQGN